MWACMLVIIIGTVLIQMWACMLVLLVCLLRVGHVPVPHGHPCSLSFAASCPLARPPRRKKRQNNENNPDWDEVECTVEGGRVHLCLVALLLP